MKKSTSIKVQLLGGLGNQLFGLHFGVAVSSRLNIELQISDSMIALGSNKSRSLQILNFEFTSPDTAYRISKKKSFKFPGTNQLLRKIQWKLQLRRTQFINEEKMKVVNFKFKPGQSFSGYFQDWVFADYLYEEGKRLIPKKVSSHTEELINLLKQQRVVCIHLRLGDYLDFPDIFTILSEEYYLNAVKYFEQDEKFKLWIFVEDRSQAVLFYPNLVDRAEKVFDRGSKLTDVESFIVLSKSSNLIASNSTYSLWAAWFVNKNQGTAIVPKQLGINGVSDELSDARWHRYDFATRNIEEGTKNTNSYKAKRVEFLDKF
jgi:hypothetical protein